MKKLTLLKKTILACSLVMALTISCAMAQTEPLTALYNNNPTVISRSLGEDQVINITVAPDDVTTDAHAITIKKGDMLTINGTVQSPPQGNWTFKKIEAYLHYYHFFKILTKESAMTQKGDSFAFRFKGNAVGQQKITFSTLWTLDGNKKEHDKLCPIIVTVE